MPTDKKQIIYPTIIGSDGKNIDGVLNYDLAVALDTYQHVKNKFDKMTAKLIEKKNKIGDSNENL